MIQYESRGFAISRGIWMIRIIILFALICVICIAEWMREIRTFKMTHYHVTSNKLKGLKRERKVAFLSDLHNYSYGDRNKDLVSAIAKEQPDYIFVTGDMLVGKPGTSTKIAEEFMKQLPAICEVFHANGNHEQRMKEFANLYGDSFVKYETVLKGAGIHCLSNDVVELEWENHKVCIYGLELAHRKYKKFEKQLLNCEEIEEILGKPEMDKYNIMLAHNPTFMDKYLDWGADLVLSGHLHGGVVRIPFVGGVISPQFKLFPKYSGEMKKRRDQTAIVSKGIGIHTIKVRLFNPAEVVVLHINGTEE